jgi:hypothetical protein
MVWCGVVAVVQVMMQKEELREVMTDVDVDMLKHLISFEVTDLDAPKVGYTLKFVRHTHTTYLITHHHMHAYTTSHQPIKGR